jgi:glycosyltransferase involved in cell wall biosynthesis
MRILFITPYPVSEAPSQRFRFEQYFPELKKRNIDFDVSPFLDSGTYRILYQPGYWWKKLNGIIRGFYRRLRSLFHLKQYDCVFIHREAAPFGPPLFEWMVTKLYKKFTVYDFDDAIWLPNASESNRSMTMLLKRFNNTKDICKWATKISVGNNFLGEYAKQFNSRVVYNPTTIDTDEYHNATADHSNHKFVIGWTGSHSTLPYLEAVVPVLKDLEKDFDFEFHVICDLEPRIRLKSLKFIKWNKITEIDDLLNFNVGIMPMPDEIWARGKCGFKALQYMALGIPAVVSDVGVNADIVDHELNGCVCKSQDEWKFYLSKLMSDSDYLHKLSKNTREKIISNYSLKSNTENFISLFSL